MKFHLEKNNENKRFIVTGGTEGIGKAITLELFNRNHDIVICGRNKEKLDGLQNKVQGIQIDLSETEKINSFIERGVDTLGRVDFLILNAAVTGITQSQDYTFKVNRDANIKIVSLLENHLRNTQGRIVLITSNQAKKPIKGLEHYGKSKRDIEDWLINFIHKENNKHIDLLFIDPGNVDTRMNKEAIDFGPNAIRERSLNAKRKGKFRDPSIVGKIITKISLSGKNFNPKTKQYDISIAKGEVIRISDENVLYEMNYL